MRRTILLLAGALLGVTALRADSPNAGHDKAQVAGIEGTWRLVKYELNGEKGNPSNEIQDMITFHQGTFTARFGNGYTWRGKYHVDATRLPPHLDEIPLHGDYQDQPILCIYQIVGDTLRIANLAAPNRPRPQRFDADGVYVETYKRLK